MRIVYSKLWKILIDHNMKKGDLSIIAKISPNTIAKLSKNEVVSLQVLLKICEVFQCDIGDIMEVESDKQ